MFCPPESESCTWSPETSELLSFGTKSRDLLCQAEHIDKVEVCKHSRLSAWEDFSDGNWSGIKVAGEHGRGGITSPSWEGVPGETEKPENNYQKIKIRGA